MRSFTLSFIFFSLFCVFKMAAQSPSDTTPDQSRIEIYLVERGKADTSGGCRYCFFPETTDLATTPFIEDHEIIAYQILGDIHRLILSSSASERLALLNANRDSSGIYVRRSFALTVNRQPVYGGWFRSRYLSFPVDWVTINTPFDEEKTGSLRVDLGFLLGIPKQYKDPRMNEALFKSLRASGRLTGSDHLTGFYQFTDSICKNNNKPKNNDLKGCKTFRMLLNLKEDSTFEYKDFSSGYVIPAYSGSWKVRADSLILTGHPGGKNPYSSNFNYRKYIIIHDQLMVYEDFSLREIRRKKRGQSFFFKRAVTGFDK
ncbi:MAG: hypothetical protein ACJ75J_03750 [Cytophagaceae bacterium]